MTRTRTSTVSLIASAWAGATAFSMYIDFRLSCPTDYPSLIADRAAKVLR